jgi:ferrous iron transport protein A
MDLLSKMKVGTFAEITFIENSSIYSKLLEMGFLIGTKVELVFKAPLGDPIAVEVNGTVFSLRKDEASCIQVKQLHSDNLINE